MAINVNSILQTVSDLTSFGAYSSFTLGGVSFQSMEVPETLGFGGTVHNDVSYQPGGGKRIGLLGAYEDDLTWSGVFLGAQAVARAQAIDALRVAQKPVAFIGAGQSRQVIIKTFRWNYMARGARIPYSIECIVVPPKKTTTSGTTKSALASLIGTDAAAAVTQVTDAVGKVTSYTQTAVGVLKTYAGELTPLANLVGAGGALASASDSLTAVSSITSAGSSLLSTSAIENIAANAQSATTSLTSVVTSTGEELSSIGSAVPSASKAVDPFSDAGGLVAAAANAGVHANSIVGGANASRIVSNISLTGSGT